MFSFVTCRQWCVTLWHVQFFIYFFFEFIESFFQDFYAFLNFFICFFFTTIIFVTFAPVRFSFDSVHEYVLNFISALWLFGEFFANVALFIRWVRAFYSLEKMKVMCFRSVVFAKLFTIAIFISFFRLKLIFLTIGLCISYLTIDSQSIDSVIFLSIFSLE